MQIREKVTPKNMEELKVMNKYCVLYSVGSELCASVFLSDQSQDVIREIYEQFGHVHYIHEVDTINVHV